MSDPSVWTPGGDSALVQLVVDSLTSSSVTSLTIGAGTQTLTVGIAKLFIVGNWLFVVDTTNSLNYMLGQIVSYNNSTGALVLSVPATGFNGSGTHTSWTVTVSGLQGISGSLSGNVSGDINFLGLISMAQTLTVTGAASFASTVLLAADPVLALQAATKQYVDALVPIGMMIDYTVNTVPNTHWLVADGSAISRTTYATYFGLINTGYGVGNGTTTFNIPNMQRRVSMGAGGTGTGTIGNTVGSPGGAETVTLTKAQIPTHTHTILLNSLNAHGGNAGSDTPFYNGAGGVITGDGSADGLAGQSHNNIQPTMVMNKLIRVL
jgi:microcystin-dependent protein